MEQKKYNGWSNYATWRVNLELFDGISWVPDDVFGDSVFDFSEQLKGHAENEIWEAVENPQPNDGSNLAYDYAMAFISDVNWYEIAHNINEDHGLGLSE
jgi:hypothetical protein